MAIEGPATGITPELVTCRIRWMSAYALERRAARTGHAGRSLLDDLVGSLHHSITWSARASSEGAIVRPSALAVLRLMTSSNFVGSAMGSSAGLAPFKILSMYVPACQCRRL